MNDYSISIGNCGEYFVAAELERRGFTAAVPMSNTKDFDILAINRETHRQIALQVKTKRGCERDWILKKRNEEIDDKNVYYVFVVLHGLDNPEYYIVESALIAESVRKGHNLWLGEDGKNGKHKDTSMRKFTFNTSKYNNILKLNYEDYKDKWDKLK